MKIDIRCPHERDRELRTDIYVSDHKPLTFREMKSLLETAATADVHNRNRIQVRLNQAIPGMTCPRPTVGKVARRMTRLDALYVKTDPKNLPEMADAFWAIIQEEK